MQAVLLQSGLRWHNQVQLNFLYNNVEMLFIWLDFTRHIIPQFVPDIFNIIHNIHLFLSNFVLLLIEHF